MRRVDTNGVVSALQNSKIDAVLDGSVVDRRVEQATAAMTPRNSKGYAPGQKRFLPALTDTHHFGTVAALRMRETDLAKFKLTPEMRVALGVWGATYTQAVYTDGTNAKQARALLAQLDLMVASLNTVAQVLMATMDASELAKAEKARADALEDERARGMKNASDRAFYKANTPAPAKVAKQHVPRQPAKKSAKFTKKKGTH